MASPLSIKEAIANALEDLSTQNFEKFRHRLLDRRTNPRIRRGRLEGQNFLGVTEVMVSIFTEYGALLVTQELLRRIDCNEEADELGKAISPVGKVYSDDHCQHFVDTHRLQLIQRVANIDPILDGLLHQNAIQQEIYDRIRKIPTPQDRMRELYSSVLNAGQTCKDIFYQLLNENNPYLIKELKNI